MERFKLHEMFLFPTSPKVVGHSLRPLVYLVEFALPLRLFCGEQRRLFCTTEEMRKNLCVLGVLCYWPEIQGAFDAD